MKYIPTSRPAKPGKVTKLNPVIVRAMHMSRPAQRQLTAAIERTAELIYATSTATGSA